LRSQAVMIASYLASMVIVLAVTILFLRIFSYTSSYSVEQHGQDIYDILSSKPIWSAEGLAREVLLKTDAYYVRVNITIYDLVNGSFVGRDFYEIKTVGISLSDLNVRTYMYSVATRDAYLYTYYLEVGYR